jgi:hypothetical protein
LGWRGEIKIFNTEDTGEHRVGLGRKLLYVLKALTAGMGCFDCVRPSCGRSHFAQHDIDFVYIKKVS